jgi:hypothetical protein
VAFVRTDILEEGIASNMKVKRIRDIGTMLAVTSNFCTKAFKESTNWDSSGLIQAKALIYDPSANKTSELLKLNTNQL